MQAASSPGDLFDIILEQGRALVLSGPAKTRAEVMRRERFVRTAWDHRLDWIAAGSCPIRGHRAHACEDEVRHTLRMIGGMVAVDAERLEMEQPDHGYLNKDDSAVYSLCFDKITGRVRAYIPEEFAPIFDEDQDVALGLMPGETSFRDIYLDETGRYRRVQWAVGPELSARVEQSVAAPASKPTSAQPLEETSPPSPGTATLSQARAEFLDGRAAIKGDRRADEDAGLITKFMIDFLGDKPTEAVSRDDLHAFEMAMAQTPDRTGLPREAASSPFNRWKYGQQHGLAGRKMLSEMRVRNIWHRSLHMWFDWMASKGYQIAKYRFDGRSRECCRPDKSRCLD